MTATFYKNFAIKWGTNCTKCGRRLDEGASAWGYKDGALGKWRFICGHCYWTETMTFPDQPGEVEEKVSEEFLSMLPDSDPVGVKPEPPASVNMVKEKPLLERLKDEAPWRLA
jgi:hypothetical protein